VFTHYSKGLENMELTRFTGGHFFTTPFLSTRLKGELNSHSWGSFTMYDGIRQEMGCENFSMLADANFGTPPARISVPKDSDRS
jgi:hypothetical protein